MIKAKIKVFLRDTVYDPEGIIVQETLNNLGFNTVQHVKSNKYFEILFNETNESIVSEMVEKICQLVLQNPSTENYTYQLENTLQPSVPNDAID